MSQGRKNAIKVIEEIVEERKKSSTPHHDFLDHFIEEVKREGAIMNEEIAVNLVFLLLFASYETTSEATTLAIKFISDHPQVQAELVVCVISFKACLFHSIGDKLMTKVKYSFLILYHKFN